MKPSLYRPSSRHAPLLLALTFLFQQSCYHYRVTATYPDPATEYQRKTVNNLCWGLVQPKDIRPEECKHSNGLDEVYVTTNLGYTFLTVVTLGVWCPMTLEWRCAKPCSQEGELILRK